jgi:hypothetical protein
MWAMRNWVSQLCTTTTQLAKPTTVAPKKVRNPRSVILSVAKNPVGYPRLDIAAIILLDSSLYSE